MWMKPIASLLLLSVFSSAHAGKILLTSGDWTAEDTSDRRNPNGYCVAYTQAEIGSTNYKLMFSRLKNSPGPMDLNIVMDGGKPATSFTLTLRDESVLSFANGGPTTVRRQMIAWNIPQHTEKLLAQLEERKDLKVKPADGSRDIRLEFSADGFKRVKEKLIEKCLNNQAFYDLAFEESFVIKRDPINPMGMTPEQVKELKRVLNAGYAIHLGINGTKSDMVKLQAKFQAQLNEKESLISRIDNLGGREIPGIILAAQNNDALEATSRTQLQQTNVTISQQRSSLNAVEAQLNTARTVIAPYEAEHADRENRAVSTRRSVNNGAQRLSDIDNGIRGSEQRINQLSSEAGAIQSQNVRIDQDLRFARRERARAQQDAENFRPREERMRRLQADPVYQGGRRELPTLQNNIQIVENALNDARGRLLARETELRVCQTRTSFIQSSFTRLPAQERPTRPNRPDGEERPDRPDRPNRPDGERPDRPNRPDGERPDRPNRPEVPTTPTPPTQPDIVTPTVPTTPTLPTTPTTPDVTPTTPTTPTVIDCTSEQGAVNAAKQVVSNLEVQMRDARGRFDQVEQRMNQIERRVENDVERIRDELQARAMQAIRQESGLENQLSVNIRRVEVIGSIEIPQQQNIINALSNERPSVQARYDQDVPQANRLEAELEDFERRVGWDAKVQAVQVAENLVGQRSNDLNRSLRQKANLENQIARCQQDRGTLANNLNDANNRKLQAETRLIQVVASLVPFDQEKARLEMQESDLKSQLTVAAQDFESQLP